MANIAQGVALLLLTMKAIHIPRSWVGRTFGNWLGAEADFLGSFMLTVLAMVTAGILLATCRLLLKRWGILTLPCLAVILVHLVQDGVLAWAAYFP